MSREIELEELIREGIKAMYFTRDYVEPKVALPAIEGWSWFDWTEKARAAIADPPWPVVQPPPNKRGC